jgi:TP901 family phage tail tape measure protein
MSEQEHKAKFTADTSGFEKGVDKVSKKATGLSDHIKKLGKYFASAFGITAVALKAVQSIKSIIAANVQFEKSLASLSAITGVTGDDLKFYGNVAREIGKTTTISANEAVEAFKLMGSARPELLKNKEALAAVTREAVILSEASGLDLRTSVESLANTMNQFNIPASDAAKTINVLAAGSKEGAEEVPGLAMAITRMGTAAAMANISLESSVAMIEVLAEKGIDSAKAGIMLRNVIIKLQSGTDKYNPSIVGLNTALTNLSKANLSAAELTEMFGLENLNAAAILIQSKDRINELTTAITGTNVAYDQHSKMVDTVEAQWKIFINTLKDVTIASDGFTNSLKTSLKAGTDFIQGLQEVKNTDNLKWWQKIAILFNQAIPGGIKYTREELDALTRSGKYASKTEEGLAADTEAAAEAARKQAEAEAESVKQAKAHSLTVKGYREKIEELTESLGNLTIGHGEEAEAIKNEIAQLQALIDKTLNYKTIIKTPDVADTGFTVGMELMQDTSAQKELDDILKQVDEDLKTIKPELTAAQQAAKSFGDELMQAGIQGSNSMKEFARVAVDVAEKVIATYVAEAVAGAVKSALVGVPFPFNIAAAGIAGGLAAAAINAAIPEFAAGGGVSGPTMAMIGEAPGISRSNPEYIGTAKQLSQMGIGGKALSCRVSRGDLLFVLNESQASSGRNF